jgi:DNA-binding transcriptional LysR family regulator
MHVRGMTSPPEIHRTEDWAGQSGRVRNDHADTGADACSLPARQRLSSGLPNPRPEPEPQVRIPPVRRREINLAGVDLNLLVALEALLSERQVTLAASRIGLSQPAMSRALGRLRDLFQDDLLVRSSSRLVLTRRAEYLAAELPRAMAALRTLIGNADADQDTPRTTLTIAMPDHQSLVLLSRLSERLRTRAPHIDLLTQPSLVATTRRLEAGEIDLAIGCMRETSAGLYRRALYTDRFACLVRKDHPVLSESWNADRFASLRHAMIAPAVEEGFAQVYDRLSELQFIGCDPLLVPNAMSAPLMIAETDIALILPMRTARRVAALLPLTVLEVPIDLPPYDVSLLWHERGHRDPDCARLRCEIASVALAIVAIGRDVGSKDEAYGEPGGQS